MKSHSPSLHGLQKSICLCVLSAWLLFSPLSGNSWSQTEVAGPPPLHVLQTLAPEGPLENAREFTITLSILAEPGSTVLWPDAVQTKPGSTFLELLGTNTGQALGEDGKASYFAHYRWMSYLPGKLQIGPFSARLDLPDGTTLPLEAPAVTLEVAALQDPPSETLPTDVSKELRVPPAPPEDEPLWWALSALPLLFLALWLWLRRKGATREGPRIPPHETAFLRLKELERKELENLQAIDAFYVDLSLILRGYLEERFLLPIREKTTAEIKQSFSLERHGAKWTFRLYQLLERADLVKYARFKIGASAAFEDLQAARTLIQDVVDRDRQEEENRKREAVLAGKEKVSKSGLAP